MLKGNAVSVQPYKGTRDFYPEEMRKLKYLFSVWREVAELYGYEEYLMPLLEEWELYAEKSGEELVNTQLYEFTDRGGRRVAIRPEKTPSLARMVAARLQELPKPVRWFNIANNMRYEKPQRGRTREFFQFDIDILGEASMEADAEVIETAVAIMKRFGADESMFNVKVNNRIAADFLLKELGVAPEAVHPVRAVIDKFSKISPTEFGELLEKQGLTQTQIDSVRSMLTMSWEDLIEFESDRGVSQLIQLFTLLESRGISQYVSYAPDVVRGLDYYTGTVIEQFDLNPENKRAMYGGGRYDDLVSLFGKGSLPGVGYAMGNITLMDFMDTWSLWPDAKREANVFVPLLDDSFSERAYEVCQELRGAYIGCERQLSADRSISKQLNYANKKGFAWVIIIGQEEVEKGYYTVKNMRNGRQKTYKSVGEIIKVIQSETNGN